MHVNGHCLIFKFVIVWKDGPMFHCKIVVFRLKKSYLIPLEFYIFLAIDDANLESSNTIDYLIEACWKIDNHQINQGLRKQIVISFCSSKTYFCVGFNSKCVFLRKQNKIFVENLREDIDRRILIRWKKNMCIKQIDFFNNV